MKLSFCVHGALVALTLTTEAAAQTWRETAAGLGGTTRVLVVGTRPEDEDNALIAWLSLGRHIETAYLSLTRGESGVNVVGTEQRSSLAVVRTAELLAERQRDGAHQYFTRAYDFGPTPSDSIANAAWPHDSLLKDVVSVIRAFRPHVIISQFSESADADATHRVTWRLAREAFAVAGDTAKLPTAATSRLSAWTVSRLFTHADSARAGAIAIDVGEFDRSTGRSYAELGAEIRRLQRTQPAPPAPAVGHIEHVLRLESARSEDDGTSLFGNADTTWSRFRGGIPVEAQSALDSLGSELGAVRALASSAPSNALAVALARVAKRTTDVRLAFTCNDVSGVPSCAEGLGDLAVSLNTVRERANRALIGAAGLVVDGTVGREVVAAGDSVPVTVTVFNGGTSPVVIRRLAAASRNAWSMIVRDSILIRADSIARWSTSVWVPQADYSWWQMGGLQGSSALHRFSATRANPVVPQLINGEDRIPTTGVDATISVGGIDVPVSERPLVYRAADAIRGDMHHPLAGTMPRSILLARTAEYERAGVPVDRLLQVYVSSARTIADTVAVTLRLPRGLTADSATRVVTLPPFGVRNLFFRLRGTLVPGSDTIATSVRTAGSSTIGRPPSFDKRIDSVGIVTHDYPHIPSQRFIRFSKERLEVVDLRIPARLNVAYVKGSDDLQRPLGDLQVKVQTLEPSLLSAVDLSGFSTVLVGADALRNEALVAAVPALREFMRKGGTVVVMPGGSEIARSGLLPYPIGLDAVPRNVVDPAAEIRTTSPTSPVLNWPNAITAADFRDWTGERARNVPAAFDARYRTVISTGDVGQMPTAATILVAPVGRGMIVYTSLSLDLQLAAVNSGGARLLVNLLAAGLGRAPGDVPHGT